MQGSEGTVQLLLDDGSITLRTLSEGASVLVIGASPDALWPIELLRAGRAHLQGKDGPITAAVDLEGDPVEVRRILDRFRDAYGPERVERWFPRPGRVLRLTPMGPEQIDPYDRWLRMEFDAAAAEYEGRIRANPVELAARGRSIRFLRATFRGADPLLELGSGPGIETLEMLRDGHEVTAVDVSGPMLERLEQHARDEGLRERLTTVRTRMRDLRAVRSGPFAGGYSTFGALNCERDLRAISREIAPLIGPSGEFVAGVYNRVCLSEMVAFASVGRPDRALARLHSPVLVGSSRFSVDWFPYSARDLHSAFSPYFVAEAHEGIGLWTPPPGTNRPWLRWPRLLKARLRWDDAWGRRRLAERMADQVLVRFRRGSMMPSHPTVDGGDS